MQTTVWHPDSLVPQLVTLGIVLVAFTLMCMSYSTSFSDRTRKRLTIAYACLLLVGVCLCGWMVHQLETPLFVWKRQ